MKRTDLFFRVTQMPIDGLMVFFAFVLSYWLRRGGDVVFIVPFPDFVQIIIRIIPFWLFIYALEGLYNTRNRKTGWQEFAGVIIGSSAGIMLVVGWLFLFQVTFFSRLVVIYTWLLSIPLVLLGRYFWGLVRRGLYRFGVGVKRLLIVGSCQTAQEVVKSLGTDRFSGYRLAGIVRTNGHKQEYGVTALGALDELAKILLHHPVDEILIADQELSDRKILEIMRLADEEDIVLKTVPNTFEVRSSRVLIGTLAAVPILEFRRTALEGWGTVVKRATDVVLAGLALIILSPVLLAVAIAIKLTSRGPVIFRQTRVGPSGEFTFYKFRSMHENAHLEHAAYMKKYGNMFKLKDDPRVTPVGRFLRRTSLDELPQLWNVLKGDMSLVGPRPPMLEEVANYTPHERRRLQIKPGLTGLWQVSGRSDLTFQEWLRLDVYYIENWSFWLDLQIILKTIGVLLKKRGAY